MIITITGPMFSGKSTLLIEEYKNMTISESPELFKCFKPAKDNRTKTKIRARNIDLQLDAIVIKKFEDILNNINEHTKYIFIDEVQFIEGNYKVLQELSIDKNITIVVAGLNMTSELEPFGQMPNILAISDIVEVKLAECSCGKLASYTYCKVKKENEILVGDVKEYVPVCSECYKKYKGAK